MRRYKVLIHYKGGRFSLLDLDVPTRSKGGVQSTDNGRKFLDEICAPAGPDTPATIVLMAADAKCGVSPTRVMNLAARLMRRGAAKKKHRACRRQRPGKAIPDAKALPGRSRPTPAKPAAPIPFTGGELFIRPDCVDLDGVVVLTDQGTGLMRQILLVLKAKQDGLIHDSLSVKKLAARTDPDADVAKAILQFRDTVTREMARERNVHCGRMAVIESGRHGYRFAKGVRARLIEDEAPHEVHEARREAPAEPGCEAPHEARGCDREAPAEPGCEAPHEAREPGREAPHGRPEEPSLNERHKWIVAEYLAGRRPSNKDIQKANRCSRATAARDLQTLRNSGMLKGGQRRQAQQARTQA